MLCMERTMWTDERLDQQSERIEGRFDRLDAKIDDLRRDVHNQFIVTTSAILALAGVMVAQSL
jgi:hypothetical protein